MKQFIAVIIFIFSLLATHAQVRMMGVVRDATTLSPLRGASVMIKNKAGKILKFTTTKSEGNFTLQPDSLNGTILEISMLNFAKQSLPLDSVSLPIVVNMEPKTTMLQEVTIKAESIREQGDTITYRVGAFAQKQDRSIGDVLARMPGMKVESSGRIQYQGEDINKFYIEGSDLLGGKYGIATNGISQSDVSEVEVMENHQPMQVLSGINFSDRAAINLKLKGKAKATWNLHGSLGGGYDFNSKSGLWEGEFFAMAAMPTFQNITTLKTNNTGHNLQDMAFDFFNSGRGTDLRPAIQLAIPGAAALDEERSLFNRSLLASSNSLWKTKNADLKTQIDYSFNRIQGASANQTTYFLPNETRVITENNNGSDRSNSLTAKVVYEVNQRTAFINNTLQSNLDWDDMQLNTTGSIANCQKATLPDYYIGNSLKLIKRFNKKHLVAFHSKNDWELMPQSLSIITPAGTIAQQTRDHAFFTNEKATYSFVFAGMTIGLEGGLKGYIRQFTSSIPELPQDIPGETENVVNTNYLTLFLTPNIEYRFHRVNISLNAPISSAFYRFDKAIANRNECYFSPSLSINWKPSNRIAMHVNAATGRAPMNLNMIYPGVVMRDYRSFSSGVDEFYNTSSKNLSTGINYKNSVSGIFANAIAFKRWNNTPYTLAQKLYGDYIVYSYSSASNHSNSFNGQGNVGKSIDCIRGSMSLNGSFMQAETHLLAQDQNINSVSTSWSAGGKIGGSIASSLSFDLSCDFSTNRMSMNDFDADWLRSARSGLLLNILPSDKWEWRIKGNYYLNELMADNFKQFLLFDTKLIFKPNPRIELSASLTNILNKTEYNYINYNQLSSFESCQNLRGRELLITITVRK